MKTKDFYFELPTELIAQTPLSDRAASRLLVLNKQNGQIKHDFFKNIANYLNKGDCLVLNNTKVIPARLIGRKTDTGAAIEILLLRRETSPVMQPISANPVEEIPQSDDIWEILVKPGKKCRAGAILDFGEGILKGEIIEVLEDGNRRIKFTYQGIFEEILDKLGEMPLPPYITKKLADKNRYQTVYAKHEGSAAAPTAGLHFTEGLLSEIKAKGVLLAYVTLHVGLGTFRPVKVENVALHHMHSEYYEISKEACEIINRAKANGGRVICVGTTSLRTIESVPFLKGMMKPKTGDTDIFIYPGYHFNITDSLITNFHLPESSLMMLVSALAGREFVMTAYHEAIKEKYRFFSFGDAMLIV
ncbi:MAG: tRNA preQ1(34) S-adenosylmethionine ribosyltransferase-isomerase QueA [Lachnospiraceae bacterium]|nr:tRNA preQ1(34) S-adenosylmethionine ribosyltransferase-isomerase QueA [Lachnospiraceae bacterium]